MAKILTSKKINLSKEDFLKLLDAYQKIGQILSSKKMKKIIPTAPAVKSLYGIWKGIKVDEKDFESAKKSLFRPV